YQFQVSAQQQEAERLKKEKGEQSEEYKKALASIEELKKKTIEQAFHDVFGMTPDAFRSRLEEEKQAILQSQVRRHMVLGEMARDKVLEAFKKKVDTSDKALRESYEQFTYQQLLISSSKHPDPFKKAQQVLQEIKNGLPFEKAVAKYSDREPLRGEKKEASGMSTDDRLTILSTENLKFLLGMKPGDISDVVRLDIGAAIYKLVKRETKLPQNFETARAFRITQMQQLLGDQALRTTLSDKKRNAKIAWSEDALRLVYEFDDLIAGELSQKLAGPAHQHERVKILRKIMDDAKKSPGDPHLLALVRYACFNQLIAEAPNEEVRSTLQKERLSLYEEIAQEIAYLPFKMEYIGLLLDAKRAEEAIAQIEDVATFLSYDEQNEPTVNQLGQYLDRAEPLAPASKQTIARIRKELEEWRKQVEEDKKARAEQQGSPQPPITAPPKPEKVPDASQKTPPKKGS
ncbi:MAG: peptidylprolyl isomerase, partial [Candidatus Caldarchaeum sp.]